MLNTGWGVSGAFFETFSKSGHVWPFIADHFRCCFFAASATCSFWVAFWELRQLFLCELWSLLATFGWFRFSSCFLANFWSLLGVQSSHPCIRHSGRTPTSPPAVAFAAQHIFASAPISRNPVSAPVLVSGPVPASRHPLLLHPLQNPHYLQYPHLLQHPHQGIS